MEKISTSLFLLLLTISSLQAQSKRDKPLSLITGTSAITSQESGRGGGPTVGLGDCDFLFTVDTATNGNDGIMFEITAAQPIIIRSLNCLLEGDTGHVKIYYKTGSYTGSTGSPANWTFADSALVVPEFGSIIRLPINLSLKVGALQTVSFYITGNGGPASVAYNNGTTEGNIFVQDANLAIKEGVGVNYPFGTTFSPRAFRGSVNYCLDTPTVCKSLTTTFAAGNGNDGAMFSIEAKSRDLLIENILPVAGSGNYSVYYKDGPYTGFETTPAAWNFIDSASLVSPGSLLPAPGFSNLNVVVPANQRTSFYVTGHGDSGGLEYSDGILLDSLFASDNNIRFFEGTGVSYPFAGNFSPRVFNGIINYCFLGDTIAPALNITTSASDPTSSASIPVTFTFTKPVTGFDLSDILASNGSIAPLSGSGSVYTSSLTFTGAGLARVIVPAGAGFDQSGNPSKADTLEIVYTPVGITDLPADSRFAAGYNAGNETVFAASLAGELLEQMQLYTLQGQLVLQAAPNSDKSELNVSGVAKGVYICTVTMNGETHNRKLTIY